MATRRTRLARLRARSTSPTAAQCLEALGALRSGVQASELPAQRLLLVRELWNRCAMAERPEDRIAALAVGWRVLQEAMATSLVVPVPEFVLRAELDRCCGDAMDALTGGVTTGPPSGPERPQLVLP